MSRPYVIPVGPFGTAVAQRMAVLADVRVAPAGTGETAVPPDASAVVLAAAGQPPGERLDTVAFARGTAWLPVVLDHPWLRIGPVVVPGAGPCHGCYRRRARQHADAPGVAAALDAHYRRHPGAGPSGHLPSLASFAAATAVSVLADPAGHAGRVYEHHVVTQRSARQQVVGVHGCPRCGLGRDEATRSYDRLSGWVRAWAA